MSSKRTSRFTLLALAAATAAPIFVAQPAAAEGDYGDYRYRAFLATETAAEKAARTGTDHQSARVGAEDASADRTYNQPRRNRFYIDVAPEDEQHYRE